MFIHKLIEWYEKNKRELPWRATKNPYFIWLSEVILQQTRVAQGLPYYLDFIKKFPKIEDLAAANESEVLRIWQGLGYYSRARNLHKTSQIVVNQHNGNFPNTFEEIIKLPGIGNYTAAAIGSIAFENPVAAIDGNAIRVYSRILGYAKNVETAYAKKKINEFANTLIKNSKPSIFNQAIMELGATICKPKNPECEICPLETNCEANLKNLTTIIPTKNKKSKAKIQEINYLILLWKRQIFIKKREEDGIWKNLYDFIELENHEENITNFAINEIIDIEAVKLKKILRTQKTHILTHRKLEITFNLLSLISKRRPEIKNISGNWVDFIKFEELPKPIIVEKFRKEILAPICAQVLAP